MLVLFLLSERFELSRCHLGLEEHGMRLDGQVGAKRRRRDRLKVPIAKIYVRIKVEIVVARLDP